MQSQETHNFAYMFGNTCLYLHRILAENQKAAFFNKVCIEIKMKVIKIKKNNLCQYEPIIFNIDLLSDLLYF